MEFIRYLEFLALEIAVAIAIGAALVAGTRHIVRDHIRRRAEGSADDSALPTLARGPAPLPLGMTSLDK